MSIGSTPPDSYSHLGFVTTSRADAGIYEPVLRLFSETGGFRLSLFAGGTHLSDRFGRTIDTLPKLPGLTIIPVENQIEGDRPVDVAAGVGRAVEAFGRALAVCRPDLLMVLGDRAEMLAAALAATVHRIPLAHLHGGESTSGAYDDACRHAITKLAHVHLTALPQYATCVHAMGEAPWRVHVVGAPALDALRGFTPEPIDAMFSALGLETGRPLVLVVFHAETLSAISPTEQIDAVLRGIASLDVNLLFIGTNADVGHGAISSRIEEFCRQQRTARLRPNLSRSRFWSCMAHAQVLVGNSSAGIIEAASFGLPVVNIGNRQGGRVRGPNVIDASFHGAEIDAAIRRAMDPSFRKGVQGIPNPYGDGRAAERILAILRKLPGPQSLLIKANE